MADRVDVLIELWKDERQQALQAEGQRAALTNIVIVVVAAGLGFVSQKRLGPSLLVVTLPMMLLGLYGALSCLKYRERFSLHSSQARRLRIELGRIDPTFSIEAGRQETKRRHRSRFSFLVKIRLYALWVAIHAGVAVIGGILSICALLG
ncbi:hypothetical protein ACFU5O_32455 [Streptomyces sp. NPDC057445]|uniref:hypothetical protein n=1 Tax=Streptomyces sp. NPDC057445 TaxID=3346136 RepID=UPI00367F5B3F